MKRVRKNLPVVREAHAGEYIPHAGGRPTDYKAEYCDAAYKMCLVLNATDAQLALMFDVAEATIHKWKLDHPEFSESIKNGKELADARVAKSLYERAMGYSHPDVHISQHEGHVILTPITKHYPPDPASCIFWLKNRQGKQWRERVELSGTVTLAALLEKQGEKE